MACCSCGLEPIPSSCRQVITSADLATLLYTQGLDVNLCTKFAPVVAGLSLVDCEGNPIVIGQPVVTCAEFSAQLCEAVLALAYGGDVIFGDTTLVGSDCLTYTIPSACDQIAEFGVGAEVVLGVTPLVGDDCLTHVVPETPFTFTDTSTIDGTTSGPFGHDLTAVVKVSAFPGNEIITLIDGLYAPEPDVVDINVVGLDTPCFDITVTEAPANTFTISGAPIVSPNAGNSLSCAGNGLYVPTADVADIIIVAEDTACLDLTVTEAPENTFTITGEPVISPNAGNILICTGNGLYVPEGSAPTEIIIQAVDNGCIELDAVESPAGTWTITPTLVISPNAGNEASCLDNGLYVPPGAVAPIDCASVIASFDDLGNTLQPGDGVLADDCEVKVFPDFVAVDTNSINTTVTNAGTQWNFDADLILANTYPGFPAGCNSLVIVGDGVAAPPNSTSVQDTILFDAIREPASPLGVGGVVTSAVFSINVINPSNCRDAIVHIVLRHPKTYFESGAAPYQIQLFSEFAVNFPAVAVFPMTYLNRVWDTGGANENHEWPQIDINFFYTVPPGFVGDFSEQVTFTNLGGALALLDIGQVRLSYSLHTI